MSTAFTLTTQDRVVVGVMGIFCHYDISGSLLG